MHRIYDDWLDLMLYSLQGDDEAYPEIMENYSEEDAKHFSEAFGELQYAMSETDADILGVVYEELGQSSDHFGQHFTPHGLCDAKAEAVIDKERNQDGPYTVLDPACGSGRLLMSASKVNPNGVFYGVDKDATCAKMTALNLTFFNLDGYAVHGDSLKVDYHRVWETSNTFLGGDVRELDGEDWENPYDVAQGLTQSQGKEERERVRESDEVDVDLENLRKSVLSEFEPDESNDLK